MRILSRAQRAAAFAAFAAVVCASACGASAGSETAGPTSVPRTATTVPATGSVSTTAESFAPSPPSSSALASSVPTTALSTSTVPRTVAAVTGPPSTRPTVATSAPPTTVAHADQFSFDECGHDSVADPQAVANSYGVPGPAVALISDSIGTQVRFGLIAGYQHHWVVWSRCGAAVDDALAAGVPRTLARFVPTVVVVALGTNDTGYPNPQSGPAAGFAAKAATLLDQIGPGPCVVWVNVAQVGDQALQTQMDTINAGITALFLRGVHVSRWSDVVASDPSVLVDRVHLSHHGVERRIQLLDDAVNSCAKKTK